MKKLLLVWLSVFTVWCACAGERVIFVPGWYTEWINYSSHLTLLKKMFPEAEIQVHKWDSNRLWKNAKISAQEEVDDICAKIKKSADSGQITLIGHSLGGAIAIKSAGKLAAENINIKQIILLGTAANPGEKEFAVLKKVSALPVINIFCPDDNILKLYIRQEQEFPLGFCGIGRRMPHFLQFRMPVADGGIMLGKLTLPEGRNLETLRESAAHLAVNYLKYLQLALAGKCQEFYMDYAALEKIAAQDQVTPDKLPGFRTIAAFDSWELSERKLKRCFKITAPSGNKFYYADRLHAERNFREIVEIIRSSRGMETGK